MDSKQSMLLLDCIRQPVTFNINLERIKQHSMPTMDHGFHPQQEPPRDVVGIGTSNRSIENFIGELQRAGVTDVVDIRQAPRSRYFPHFNRNSLQEALGDAGIEYHWHGDTLGNPKDENGNRTMAGFKQYMKSDSYTEGLVTLKGLVESARGTVALVCSEKNEQDCHRKFVLEDLQQGKLFD